MADLGPTDSLIDKLKAFRDGLSVEESAAFNQMVGMASDELTTDQLKEVSGGRAAVFSGAQMNKLFGTKKPIRRLKDMTKGRLTDFGDLSCKEWQE